MSSEREKLNELKNNLLELEELENGRQQKLGEQKNSMNEVRQNYSRIQEQLQQLQSELTKQNDTLADITSKQEVSSLLNCFKLLDFFEDLKR